MDLRQRLSAFLVRVREKVITAAAHGRSAGQGMVEYALVLVLIAIVVIVILAVVGKKVNNVYSNITNGLSS